MILKALICFLVSLAAVWILMPYLIAYLKKISFNQSVSEYSLEEYKRKDKTPIMGGLLFILVPVIVTLIAHPASFHELDTLIVLLAFAGYGVIGFIDDFLIAVKKNNDGLKPKQKFALQLILAIVFYLVYRNHASLELILPFTHGKVWYLGVFYGVLILLMFTGSSNAVNLTDGMDGLAAGCTFIALIPFLVFSIQQQKEAMVIFIASLLGALLGYLHYNVKPAKVFMGDTGSLALGGVLAALSMILKKEIALVFIGGIFVVETLCVMIQISSVKIRHKKVFIYTPIHYAFVIKGMGEKQVVRMFWLIEIGFAVLGLWIGLNM